MIERFAIYLSNISIQIGAAKDEERPFLIYGYFCLISDTIQISLLLVISLLSSTVAQVAVFTFCFGLLKRTIGGWHAKHHFSCLVLYSTLTMVCTQTGQYLTQRIILPLTLILAIIMWAFVWLMAPVEHPNNPQSPQRLTELKQISRLISSLELLCIIIILAILLYNTNYSHYPDAAMGAFSAALALIVPNEKTSSP